MFRITCSRCEAETSHRLASGFRGPDRVWARIRCERCGEEREEMRAAIEEAPKITEDEMALDSVRYHVNAARLALIDASTVTAGINNVLYRDRARALVASVTRQRRPYAAGTATAPAPAGSAATPVAGQAQSPRQQSRTPPNASDRECYGADSPAPPAPLNNESPAPPVALPPSALKRAQAYGMRAAGGGLLIAARGPATDGWLAGYGAALADLTFFIRGATRED